MGEKTQTPLGSLGLDCTFTDIHIRQREHMKPVNFFKGRAYIGNNITKDRFRDIIVRAQKVGAQKNMEKCNACHFDS